MAVSFQRTIPLLRIFDLEKAKEFYVGFLGFAVDWEHHFDQSAPAYLQSTCVLGSRRRSTTPGASRSSTRSATASASTKTSSLGRRREPGLAECQGERSP